jgi:two-component system NarL family sensor kinase
MSTNETEIVFLVIATIVITILMVFLIVNLLLVVRNKKLSHKNEMLHLQTVYEKNLAQAQAEIAEQTLSDIGRDLHDDIGQQLAFSIIQLNQLIVYSTAKNKDAMLQTRESVQNTLNTVRHISKTLSSDYITSFGITNALTKMAERINQQGNLHCQFDSNQVLFSSKANELFLFRIMQELISNTLKYAKASHIWMSFESKNDMAYIVYKDNGIGTVHKILQPNTQSIGISNIYKRIEMLKGTITFETSLANGLQAEIIFPN